MSPSNKPSRARRVLGVLGSVVGVTVTFVAGVAAATVIHLDMPATRRLVTTQGNAITKSLLQGDVHINRIGHIGLDGVSGIAVTIKDPDGVQVLDVTGVKVKTNALAIARSALFGGKGPIAIPLDLVQIDNVDANLDVDKTGQNLRIANAFVPKDQTPTPPSPPGRGVKVDAPDVRMTHAWVHGYPPGGQPLDADARNFVAAAHLDTNTRLDAQLWKLALDARAMPRGADPKGNITGHFTMPMVGDKPPMAVNANFDGSVGNIPTKVVASMNGSRIDATVDAHDATGNDTQTIVSEVTIKDALTLHAEAHGDLPHIDTKAQVALGNATVDATAGIDTGPTVTRIKGQVAVRNFDASKIQPTAPPTTVGLDASGDVAIGDDGVSGTAAIDTLPGIVQHENVPPIQVRAKLAGKSGTVTAKITDKTMPTEIVIELKPRTDRPDGQTITAKMNSTIPNLNRVPEVGAYVGGRATIDVSGKLDLPEKNIEAKAKVGLLGIRDHELALGMATADANVSGNLDRPVIDAKVSAHDFVTGTLPLANLDAGTRIVIDTKSGGVTIEHPRVDASRIVSPSIVATANSVTIGGGNLKVDGAEITGLGDPIHADVDKRGANIDGNIDAPRIDLKLIARVLRQDDLGVESGTLAIGGKGGLHGKDVDANFHAEVRDFKSKQIKAANATIDANLAGRDVSLGIDANLGNAGNLKVATSHLELGGPAVDPESWKKAHGKVSLDGAVDLRRANEYLPPKSLPIEDMSGYVIVQGHVFRDKASDPPNIVLHAHTKDLIVSGTAPNEENIGPTTVQGVAPWRVTGVDVALDMQNDALSGLTTVAFRVSDPHGMLVAFDSKTTLPYDELIDHPDKAKERALHAPLSAMMIVPTRRLQDLPPIVGLKDTAGSIEAELEATGTVLDPNVRFIAKGRGLRAPSMPKGVRVDTDVALDYDGKQAKLAVKSKDKDKDLLTVSSTMNVVSKEFIVGRADGAAPEWTASAKAHLAAFPLESIPQLAQQRVKGTISGDVELDDFHKDAHVKGHIGLASFKVGKVEYDKGNIDLDIGQNKLAAKLRIDAKDGFIDASATSGMTWGAEMAPALSKDQPLEAKLQAKNFRAAAIQPFVAAAVPTLDGNIDANATAKVVPGQAGAQLDGKVVFSNGTVQPAALGEELRNVRATVAFNQDGTIKLTDVSAQGIQGEIHASGNAKIDGMRLANAVVNVDIPKNKAFDFALQGQPMGQVYGKINVTASQSADAKTTKIGVDVPTLFVELPQTTKTGVESLDAKKNIRVGVFRGKNEFVKLPLDKQDTLPPPDPSGDAPSKLEVEVKLGRIDIAKGNQARVALGGTLNVGVGNETRIKGEVHALEGGWADVQGKKFVVEKASVTFDGKPDINPVVLATASWTAADGTKVYADFVGPVKTGKVVLRSEPSRPQNEILALVLFGTADGANPTPNSGQQNSDGTTKAAVSAGGGIAAQGLTNALDDMTGLQVTARIDSTDSNNPKPELEFQVSPKVSVAFAHVIGTPPITEPDLNLASLEYRFHRNWSLETTIGDQGKAQLDAIWQKRY